MTLYAPSSDSIRLIDGIDDCCWLWLLWCYYRYSKRLVIEVSEDLYIGQVFAETKSIAMDKGDDDDSDMVDSLSATNDVDDAREKD